MRTIIKAILKFFKLSKLSFIGLFILVFFSITVFSVLNNTNTNLTSSYQNISSEGNLHDFVINENYRYGNGSYELNASSATSNGNVNVTNISDYNNGSYVVNFALDLDAIKSGQNFEWTYAYNDVVNKYENDTSSSFYKEFLSFETTIVSSDASITFYNWKSNPDFVSKAYSIVSTKASALKNFVENYYEQDFISNVEAKTNTSIQSFESININNTKQNIFFKLIKASSNNQIDKVVIYDGNNLSSSQGFDNPDSAINLVINATNDALTNDASISRNLIAYLDKAQWSLDTVQFSELLNYLDQDKTYNPYINIPNPTGANADLVAQQANIVKTIIDSNGIVNDGYQVRFSYSQLGLAPISGQYEDFTSYGAIVSPYYLNKLNKTPVNHQEWLKHLNDSQASFNAWLYSISDSTFSIDNQIFVILGTGISPDFMYPIVSFNNLVPNEATQQVVYTNSTGYNKMLNSFRGNEQENFLVGKFNSSNRSLSDINNISTQYMAWPSNISAAYYYNDTSNTSSPTALRVVFIPNIVNTISLVSWFLTSFILVLSLFISIVIIKRCIENNRNSLGIMLANGYKKWEVISGLCLLIWIPIFFSTIFGYFLGLALQGSVIELLSNFWTLPVAFEKFSLFFITSIILVVLLIFLVITVFFSWFCLQGEIAEFMKDEAKNKMNKISIIVKKLFKFFNVIALLRCTIAFSSVWRLMLLSLMSALLTASLIFSINIIDSFKTSAALTYGSKKYNYGLNLVTPTLQSGQYYSVPYQQQGQTLNKKSYFNSTLLSSTPVNILDYISQRYWDASSIYGNYATQNPVFYNNVITYGNYQLISQDDLNAQTSDLFYLKNKTTTRPFVDINLGVGSISSNPWNLASQLMPVNNQLYANQAFKNMFENSLKDNTSQIDIGYQTTDTVFNYIKSFAIGYAVLKTNSDAQPIITDFGKGIPQVVTMDFIDNDSSIFYDSVDSSLDPNYNYYLKFYDGLIGGNSTTQTDTSNVPVTSVNIHFLNLLYYLYANALNSANTYSINYNKLVVDQNDSPYTYLNFNIDLVNNSNPNISDTLNMIGLNNNFTNPSIELLDDKSNLLNQALWDTNPTYINAKNANNQDEKYPVYPIVINEVARKKYKLDVGSLIKTTILNSSDRYSRIHFNVDNPIAYFKVIGINTTYQGAEFYINQYYANWILGLTINNIKPQTPTAKEQLYDYVNWNNTNSDSIQDSNAALNLLEFDYGDNYLNSNPLLLSASDLIALDKQNFIVNDSGYNGVFSTSIDDLAEVTKGVSLYSFSGLYPGTDLISPTNSTMLAVFSDQDTMKKAVQTLGFNDLLNSDGSVNVDAQGLIQIIADTFGSSSSFFIVSDASSNSTSLDVLNITSLTLTKIQDVILSLIVLITVLIIIVISSLIINDSLKMALVLKCLGLNDKKNALSFLSIYVPVFIFGLLLSIPLSFVFTTIYLEFIFSFAGILIVVNSTWWHFIVASFGMLIIFIGSYWTMWNKIGGINLSKSIK